MINQPYMSRFVMALLLFAGVTLTSCESVTNSNKTATGDVTLQFASNPSASLGSGAMKYTNDTLRVNGSNGTLLIHDIRFIVEDFELERAEEECADLEGEAEDACEEFESEPFFVDLPLQGDTLDLNTSAIEPGLYEELEFEVDDLDLDEEEEDEQTSKQQLAELIRSEFPDWPDEVSMVIIGDFISDQGDTTSFKTYAEAEVEIEMEFNPPLEIGENTVDQLLRVNIDPVAWLLRSDGTVRDLSQYDYERTGQTLEFEVEIEDGFLSTDVEEDDHEDDEEEEDESDD